MASVLLTNTLEDSYNFLHLHGKWLAPEQPASVALEPPPPKVDPHTPAETSHEDATVLNLRFSASIQRTEVRSSNQIEAQSLYSHCIWSPFWLTRICLISRLDIHDHVGATSEISNSAINLMAIPGGFAADQWLHAKWQHILLC